MKQPKQITLQQLKIIVLEQYQVESSKQLKKICNLAAKLDLRYKKSWNRLINENDITNGSVVSIADHVVRKGNALDMLDTGLQSLSEDLAAFEEKIESDFALRRKNSKKYRESLTYL